MDACPLTRLNCCLQKHGSEPSLAHLAATVAFDVALATANHMLSIGFVECRLLRSRAGTFNLWSISTSSSDSTSESAADSLMSRSHRELLQHLLRVLVAVLLQGSREEVVRLLAVAFGQVALDVAIFVERTPLVDELLAVPVLERHPSATIGNPEDPLGELQRPSENCFQDSRAGSDFQAAGP